MRRSRPSSSFNNRTSQLHETEPSKADNVQFAGIASMELLEPRLLLSAISDRAWVDSDFNGIQDDGEAGLAGVTVNLFESEDDELVETTVTDEDGLYTFEDLEDEGYYLQFVAPETYFVTQQYQGPDAALDSDIDDAGLTGEIVLSDDQVDDTVDAGFYQMASIGGIVWEDLEVDGVQEDEEPGISGVAVDLYDAGANFIATTITDDTGYYTFDSLTPGTYFLQFTQPDGLYFTLQNQGDEAEEDSDADEFGVTPDIVLTSGQVEETIDAGLYQMASIGDYVWDDANANGIQDAEEAGLEGVGVDLYDEDGNLFASTVTDSSGYYSFDDLQPAEYYLQFTALDGYVFTEQEEGEDSLLDSDVDEAGLTEEIELESGQVESSVDAGMYLGAYVGDYVWEDLDGNGIQDEGEAGLAGVTVSLFEEDDEEEPFATTVTDEGGFYSFDGLPAGEYYLVFTAPDDYVFSEQFQGDDAAIDSDADESGETEEFSLVPGQVYSDMDAGLYQTISIGDYVWEDLDCNGIQDNGETGLDDVEVNLYDEAGNLVDSTETEDDGEYEFEDLAPGTYYLQFIAPEGYVFTQQYEGGDWTTDSDADSEGVTGIFTLASGQNDFDEDAGLYLTASIGDYVWEDLNGNGIQDADEAGLDGVLVDLYDASETLIASTITADGGLYTFADLLPGTYFMQFTAPDGYYFTLLNQGDDAELDSDADDAGFTGDVSVVSGQEESSLDVGLYQPSAISDYVWEDLDGNGIQDAGEPGINGASVSLFDLNDELVATAVADENGLYVFDGLIPGQYYLQFLAPEDYVFTQQDQGDNDVVDSDADASGLTGVIALTSGQVDTTQDAGILQPAFIGDYIWEDANFDGIQDIDEAGLADMPVDLFDLNGNLVASTTTDVWGYYSFSVMPGSYYVQFTAPEGYYFTAQNQGTDPTLDSDADAWGATAVFTLVSGQADFDYDAGVYLGLSIGDYAWEDLNADGIQDFDETGLPDVTVNLFDSLNNLIATTLTDITGFYQFDGLHTGDYSIQFVAPAGYLFSPQNLGDDFEVDSDPDPTNGLIGPIAVASGQDDFTLDAGLYRTASVGNWVWDDLDADGIQDADEPGLADVTVQLYDAADNLIGTTSTDAAGNYLFSGLTPGSYYVLFAGFIISPANVGADDAIDSDADPETGLTDLVTLISGQADDSYDLGLYQLASVGDTVWNDIDLDGVQDASESPLSDVVVQLYDASNTLIGTASTDAFGNYLFSDLIPGSYYLQFIAPDGYFFRQQDQGDDDTLDSDASASGLTGLITLTSGQNDTTWDAGLYNTVSISNYVWEDMNANGIQDAGEAGLDGVTVNLYDAANVLLASAITSAGGQYIFTGLTPGQYSAQFIVPDGYFASPQDQGNDDAADSDINAAGYTAVSLVAPGQDDATWDAGMYRKVSVGDKVWLDVDGNAQQDEGEAGMDGITVNLYDLANNLLATAITAAGGQYAFAGLIPGQYYIGVVAPSGYIFTLQDSGSDDSVDSDVNSAGVTSAITLVSGQADATVDAGLYQPVSLGDYVWEDLDANGLQDIDEAGLGGVTVNLYDFANTLIASAITAASGQYSFSGLRPGLYYAQFVAPSGYLFTLQDDGGDDAVDSDTSASGYTNNITLISGQVDTTWDAGMYRTATINDRVWEDMNADGLWNVGEPGVAGVTVNLFDLNDNLVATAATGADGLYSFDVTPGAYYLQFVAPQGYIITQQDVGPDDWYDSDAAQGSGLTVNIPVISGQIDSSWDAGMYRTASVGNYVWVDQDGNGIQNNFELGLDGVTVNLFNADGSLVASTITSNGGTYSFIGLLPGSYSVQFIRPDGYVFSPLDVAGETLDSDAGLDGRTPAFTLVSNQIDSTWDAGVYYPLLIGDKVWSDTNANGVQDAGENGLGGVTVQLLRHDAGDALVASVVTAADGSYLFQNLPGGEYIVKFVAPAGYLFSPLSQGGDQTLDSNADATGQSEIINALYGQSVTSVDAGLFQLASVGSTVWDDLNANGIQDAGEPGLADVTVQLFDAADNLLAVTSTDALGNYSFANLLPGSYQVQFLGFNISPKDAGADDAADSDADVETGLSGVFTLISGQNNQTIDAGMFQFASVGNFVWLDINANGIQDAGEPGKEGVTILLLGADGVQLASTVTDADGWYSFADLTPGNYQLQCVAVGNYVFSPAGAGSSDIDSNANAAGLMAVTLISGQQDTATDAGLFELASVGDFVWEDLNANGIQDAGEPGKAGLTILLLDSSGSQVGSTVTDGSGLYSFTNIVPGTYQVVVIASGLLFSPSGSGSSESDSNADSAGVSVVTLVSGQNDATIDIGVFQFAKVGDFVWNDLNANGIQDEGEPGLDGVGVQLLDADGGVIATTATDGSGRYSFENVLPGSYKVLFSGSRFSPQDAGDDEVDSDANESGLTSVFTVTSGQEISNIDAGQYELASIGDFVWEDLDADGVQDGDEPGLGGVVVSLFDEDGNLVETTTTGADGQYLFDELIPDSYFVQFERDGFVFSPKDAADDSIDSDADESTGRTETITVISGEDDRTWDAGLFQYVSIGDYVWNDLDTDGVQDDDEYGIADVTVKLLDEDGNELSSTTTDENGQYVFDDLLPGSYIVKFEKPDDFVFSPRNAGDDEVDSNADEETGQSEVISLVSGQADFTIDAGMYSKIEIAIGGEDPAVCEFQDADGTEVTVTFKKGRAILTLVGDDLSADLEKGKWVISGSNIYLRSIQIDDSSLKSTLTIKAEGGEDEVAVLGRLNGDRPLGKLNAENVDLIDEGIIMSDEGFIGSTILHDIKGADIEMAGRISKTLTLKAEKVEDGATIVLGQADNAKASAKITFESVNDASIISAVRIDTLSAMQWLDSDDEVDLIEAPAIGKLLITGRKANSRKGVEEVVGDFEADLTLTGENPLALTLGKASIAGSLNNASWAVNGKCGTISVEEWIRESAVLSAGSIKSIETGGMDSSYVMVGLEDSNRPSDRDGFLGVSDFLLPEIGKLSIEGVDDSPFSFINSNVCAWEIGKALIANPNGDNGGLDNGLIAHEIDRLTLIQGEEKETWKDPEGLGSIVDVGDFSVELV